MPPPEPAPAHEITLTIVNGSADKPAYTLTLDRINLGRCAEVRDSRNRLMRTNDVVFTDAAGAINETVSRATRTSIAAERRRLPSVRRPQRARQLDRAQWQDDRRARRIAWSSDCSPETTSC